MTIGVAVISGEIAHAQRSLDEIIRFMEEHTDAEPTKVKNNRDITDGYNDPPNILDKPILKNLMVSALAPSIYDVTCIITHSAKN